MRLPLTSPPWRLPWGRLLAGAIALLLLLPNSSVLEHRAVVAVFLLTLLAGRGRLFVRDWLPLVGVAALFVVLRQLAALSPLPRQGASVARLEALLFGGTTPTTWLQERLYRPGEAGPLEYLATAVHASYFFGFVVVGLAIWLCRRRHFAHYRLVLAGTFALGLIGYVILPTEPPWLGARQGDAPPARRVIAETARGTQLTAGIVAAGRAWQADPDALGDPNPAAAMPSVHTAVTASLALVLARLHPALGVAAGMYLLAMGASLVYLGEHYILDLLAGVLCSVIALRLADRLTRGANRLSGGADHPNGGLGARPQRGAGAEPLGKDDSPSPRRGGQGDVRPLARRRRRRAPSPPEGREPAKRAAGLGVRGPPMNEELLAALTHLLGPAGVVAGPGSLATYEQDGFMARARPLAVCLPTETAQVAALLLLAASWGLPVTPRGAGTGLSGGATAVAGGLVIATSRMDRILRLDPQNLRATVQPGVVNADLSRAAAPFGLYYAPDPSSQAAATIGGNVAENAGGPHCLASGVTSDHVLALEGVTTAGEVVRLGGYPDGAETPGYDLTGLLTGSEGNLAFVAGVTVRLLPRAEATGTLLALFDTVAAAGAGASGVIAAGIVPAALEFVDGTTIGALRQGGFRDYPEGVAAVLLVELEGLATAVAEDTARVQAVLLAAGATEVRTATAAAERARLWAGRKGALGAFGRIAPNYYIQDGVVPRSRLVDVLVQIQALAAREGLLIANVFHAGDGNLHPTILYDAREPGLTERVIAAGAEILRLCVDAGGTLSGEHGVGLEKQAYLDWVLGPADQAAQRAVKRAFDPEGRLNPGKPFSGPLPPTARRAQVPELVAEPLGALAPP